MQVDPNVLAMLQMLLGGQVGYMPMPEFSASRGFMPMDSGTVGANINQLQDVAGLSGQGLAANPLVLAALGMTQGDQFGMVQEEVAPAVTDGETLLSGIMGSTPLDSWQNAVATGLLEGMTPEQVVDEVGEIDGIEIGDTDVVLDQARKWFDMLMMDREAQTVEKPGAGLQTLRDYGIPDPGTGMGLTDLNSRLAPALEQYTGARDRARTLDAKVVKPRASEGTAGSSSAARHRGRVAQRGGAMPEIKVLDPKASRSDKKKRLDAIGERDRLGTQAMIEGAVAEAWQRKMQELGVNPTQVAAAQRLGAIQRFAGGF